MSKARELAELGAAYDSGALSNRNIIINGAMNLDQRSSGSATTNGSSGYTTVDRWKSYDNLSAGASTSQQVTDVPDNQGFKNSLKFTVTTADSDLGTGEVLFIQQAIEGNNFSVLRYGTSSAKTSTISFWVKSSETGSFGGSLQRSVNYDRQYGFTYTISAANTWEYKTVTIPGDTGGTWPTDNTAGASLMFNLGSGSSRLISTANQWGTTSLGFQVSGTKNIAGTVNATFFVTGVQMEVGTEATPFEHRTFADELQRCSRYFQAINYANGAIISIGANYSAAAAAVPMHYTNGEMRSTPTITMPATGQTSGTVSLLAASSSYPSTTGSHSATAINDQNYTILASSYSGLAGAGTASWFYASGTVDPFKYDAEL